MKSSIFTLLRPVGINGSATPGAQTKPAARLFAFAGLTTFQFVVTSYLFNFPHRESVQFDPAALIKQFGHAAPIAAVLFLLVAWPRRRQLGEIWAEAAAAQNWALTLLANGVAFLTVALASIAFSRHAAGAPEPPWGWFGLYACLLGVAGVSLALVAAPARFWRQIVQVARLEAALALSGATVVLVADKLVRESWDALASATLLAAAALLSLYEPGLVVDLSQKLLGVGDFRVLIFAGCSGYEGIGIVTVVMALYLWVFRAELKFPNALLLLPIGMVAVWLLNAVRIAALVSIGAHLSPEVAVNGFHSQAGSIAFLLVTVGLMAASHRITFFLARPHGGRPADGPADRLLLALVAPFAALMATSLVTQAFAPNHQWLYGIKVAAVGMVLWRFRSVYRDFAWAVSPFSIAAGAAVAIAWILTDTGASQDSALGVWLSALPLWLAAIWLTVRAFGAVVLVPITEELAFRGYLHRALISRQFDTVAPGQFTWLAFLTTSFLFGLLHQRWVAGALAGAVYAAVMYRSGRLADPIAAHMTSNAIIVTWAIAAAQWSLL